MRRPIAVRGPVALMITTLLLGLSLTVPPETLAHAANTSGSAPVSADAYWTPQRMRAAEPASAARSSRAPRSAADPTPPSHPFDGLPQVGTFFWTDGNNTGRFCGGTVVRSPHRDLVVTAAHCLRSPNPKRYLSFVPQYHDGQKPHGIYPVDRIYIDQRYYDLGTDAGARWDYAVVRLAARQDGAEVEEVTGGYHLRPYPGYGHRNVRLIGYPGNSDTTHPKPLDCTSSTHRYTSTDPAAPGDFLEIACAGYIGGTSGGPFLVRDFTGYALIGVIGGYHTGGDFPDVSYSSYFTLDTLALYLHAVRGDTPAGPHQASSPN
ncbi:trypsin-like serine peptidase [Streptomyces inhibens]|uniref:trypsin-like serine peptidase n=1 Tax=Streptomyces inhibens TaxID=2293571 RepID=UPI001EE749CC|nr:trypsin-like peptidase domain-containing protein [Streptomyces inhibens]UKY47707.1 trypsin-like peptidase domain-containing protein [Streptomyces inhibens]